MNDITSMAHDRLLAEVAYHEDDFANERRGSVERCRSARDEILRRMDAATMRIDVKPDGNRV
jgi:hypothetical protein